jgi:hypothetical protein
MQECAKWQVERADFHLPQFEILFVWPAEQEPDRNRFSCSLKQLWNILLRDSLTRRKFCRFAYFERGFTI